MSIAKILDTWHEKIKQEVGVRVVWGNRAVGFYPCIGSDDRWAMVKGEIKVIVPREAPSDPKRVDLIQVDSK